MIVVTAQRGGTFRETLSLATASVEARQLARSERAAGRASYRPGRTGNVLRGRNRAPRSTQPRRFTACEGNEGTGGTRHLRDERGGAALGAAPRRVRDEVDAELRV